MTKTLYSLFLLAVTLLAGPCLAATYTADSIPLAAVSTEASAPLVTVGLSQDRTLLIADPGSTPPLTGLSALLRMANHLTPSAGWFTLPGGDAVLAGMLEIGHAIFPISPGDAPADHALAGAFYYDMLQANGLAGLSMPLPDTSTEYSASRQGSGGSAESMPLLGMNMNVRLSERMSLGLKGRYFDVADQIIDGSMTNYMAAVEYQVTKSGDIGLGYEYMDLDLDAANQDSPGLLRLQYQGPKLFASVRF